MAGPNAAGGNNGGGGRAGNGGQSGAAGDAGGSDVTSGNCTIGSSRSCRVVLGVYNGIESCFVGKQYCDTGTWGPCQDPRDAG